MEKTSSTYQQGIASNSWSMLRKQSHYKILDFVEDGAKALVSIVVRLTRLGGFSELSVLISSYLGLRSREGNLAGCTCSTEQAIRASQVNLTERLGDENNVTLLKRSIAHQ